jgi:hypothetical protein
VCVCVCVAAYKELLLMCECMCNADSPKDPNEDAPNIPPNCEDCRDIIECC